MSRGIGINEPIPRWKSKQRYGVAERQGYLRVWSSMYLQNYDNFPCLYGDIKVHFCCPCLAPPDKRLPSMHRVSHSIIQHRMLMGCNRTHIPASRHIHSVTQRKHSWKSEDKNHQQALNNNNSNNNLNMYDMHWNKDH